MTKNSDEENAREDKPANAGSATGKSTRVGTTAEHSEDKAASGGTPPTWSFGAQLTLAILVLLVISVLLIGLPILSATLIADGKDVSLGNLLMPMLAVLIGLTTVTVSGIFIFMTFRIDRGAKREAWKTALETAEKTAKKVAKESLAPAKKAVKRIKESAEKAEKGIDDYRNKVSTTSKEKLEEIEAMDISEEVSKELEKKFSNQEVQTQIEDLLESTAVVELIKHSLPHMTPQQINELFDLWKSLKPKWWHKFRGKKS